jgi:hypothetical protein
MINDYAKTNQGVSRRKSKQNWKAEKRAAGCINVNLWFEPAISKVIEEIATEEMMPRSTVVEKILKEVLLNGGLKNEY